MFHPGPHLNVLIGPNGTGKSSMVAAIVLGMGGSTKVLSAKLKLQEFIKNGKEAARIIVCLYKNTKKEKVNFERSFIANGRSTFKVSYEYGKCVGSSSTMDFAFCRSMAIKSLTKYIWPKLNC